LDEPLALPKARDSLAAGLVRGGGRKGRSKRGGKNKNGGGGKGQNMRQIVVNSDSDSDESEGEGDQFDSTPSNRSNTPRYSAALNPVAAGGGRADASAISFSQCAEFTPFESGGAGLGVTPDEMKQVPSNHAFDFTGSSMDLGVGSGATGSTPGYTAPVAGAGSAAAAPPGRRKRFDTDQTVGQDSDSDSDSESEYQPNVRQLSEMSRYSCDSNDSVGSMEEI
jgi:hypothetical protein